MAKKQRRAKHEAQAPAGDKIMKEYKIDADEVQADVAVISKKTDYVPHYVLTFPKMKPGTASVLKTVRDEIVKTVEISPTEILDPRTLDNVKAKFLAKANELVGKHLPDASRSVHSSLAGSLVHEMFGLGDLELLLRDDDLEEIVINTAAEPTWVYHKEFGWLMTNLKMAAADSIPH